MRRGKESECEEITIRSEEVLSQIDGDSHKYLGIMERSGICYEQMKRNVNTEYWKQFRLTLKSKLNTGNVFQAINIWAVPTVQHRAGII